MHLLNAYKAGNSNGTIKMYIFPTNCAKNMHIFNYCTSKVCPHLTLLTTFPLFVYVYQECLHLFKMRSRLRNRRVSNHLTKSSSDRSSPHSQYRHILLDVCDNSQFSLNSQQISQFINLPNHSPLCRRAQIGTIQGFKPKPCTENR